MLVQDVMDLAKISLNNVALSRNDNILIKYIYLGTSELYRRFNLSIRQETIPVNSDMNLYELRSSDVSLILDLFDGHGRRLHQTDVYNSNEYDYKLINFRSFLLRRPFEGILCAIYKASPVIFKDIEDEIDLPDAMLNALLLYVTYMGHSTVNRDNVNEGQIYYQRFEAACNELEMQGYKIPYSDGQEAVQTKGYV